MRTKYLCPACKEQEVPVIADRCPRCDADLGVLARLHELPSVHYNRAVDEVGQGRWSAAIPPAATAATLDPSDSEAHALFAFALQRAGAPAAADEHVAGLKQMQAEAVRALLADVTIEDDAPRSTVTRTDDVRPEGAGATGLAPSRGWGAWSRAVAVLLIFGAGLAVGAIGWRTRSGWNVQEVARQTPPPEAPPLITSAPAAPRDPAAQVLVLPGDTYVKLALRFYGDGAGWRRIADRNPHHADPLRLPAGVWLAIPLLRVAPNEDPPGAERPRR